MSEAILEMTMKFVGTDKVIRAQLDRNAAPATIQALIDLAPMTRRCMMNVGTPKAYYMILVEIKRGREKSPSQIAKAGEILYDPLQDALYMIFRDCKLRNPGVKIGMITQGLDLLPTMPNGIMVEIPKFKDITELKM
jgi:hypothetical protein